MRDPYGVLGLSPGADPLAVRRAYQKLARRWHPALRAADPEAEGRFRAAAQAYAVLSDKEKRKQYDAVGHSAFEGFRQGTGAGWQGFAREGFGGGGFQQGIDLSDLFGDLFGGGAGFRGGAVQSGRRL